MREKKELNEDMPISPAQEKSWIKQIHVIYGGLIGIGVVMIQPFLYQGEFTGTAAKVSVVSFALSIPILAALLLLNHEEDFRHHLTKSKIVMVTRVLAQNLAFVGIAAGFWHISPLAGASVIAGAIIGMSAHSAGYVKLYKATKRSLKT